MREVYSIEEHNSLKDAAHTHFRADQFYNASLTMAAAVKPPVRQKKVKRTAVPCVEADAAAVVDHKRKRIAKASKPSTTKPPQVPVQYSWGVDGMLHRCAAGDNKWMRCSGTFTPHLPDSRVHRFSRETGFLHPDAAEEEGIDIITAARAANRASGVCDNASHDQVRKFCAVKTCESNSLRDCRR